MIVAKDLQGLKEGDGSLHVDILPENVTKNDTVDELLLESNGSLAYEIPLKYDVDLPEDWDKVMGHVRVGYPDEDIINKVTDEITYSLSEKEVMTQAQIRHKIVSDSLLAGTICALAAAGVVIMSIVFALNSHRHDSARLPHESPTSLSILTGETNPRGEIEP